MKGNGGWYSEWRDSKLGQELGPRQVQILQLVADGKANLEIAQELGISCTTVRNNLYLAYGKLGVSSRMGAVIAAGLLVPPDSTNGL